VPEVKLDPQLQQKLNAIIASIKVTPITIPVNFVPGNMPNMTGGMNMPGAGGGAMPGIGGGGGGGNLYNPFGPRGLSRMVGSGLAAYGFMEAMSIQRQGQQNAQSFASAGGNMDAQARAMLEGRDKLLHGSFARKMLSSFSRLPRPQGYEQENILASLDDTKATTAAGDTRYRSGMESIGRDRAAGIASAKGIERQRRESAALLRQATEANRAVTESDSAAVSKEFGDRRAHLNRQLGQADHLLPYDTAEEKGIKAQLAALDREEAQARRGVGDRQGARTAANNEENTARDRDIAGDEAARHITSEANRFRSLSAARATDLSAGGDALGAMRVAHESDLATLNAKYEAEQKKLAGQELTDSQRNQNAAVIAMQATQGLSPTAAPPSSRA